MSNANTGVPDLLAQLLSRHSGTFNTIGNLLECYISCKVWTTVLRFNVDGEGRESWYGQRISRMARHRVSERTTVIGCSKLIYRDILGRF